MEQSPQPGAEICGASGPVMSFTQMRGSLFPPGGGHWVLAGLLQGCPPHLGRLRAVNERAAFRPPFVAQTLRQVLDVTGALLEEAAAEAGVAVELVDPVVGVNAVVDELGVPVSVESLAVVIDGSAGRWVAAERIRTGVTLGPQGQALRKAH